MRLTLAILAAGRSQRFGRLKQLEPVGPNGESLFEYTVCDAIRLGCNRVVFVLHPHDEDFIRAAVTSRLIRSIPIEFISQDLKDVPPGFQSPPERYKPWGTAHAVLALRNVVREPFLLTNADDFYGPQGIRSLAYRIRTAFSTDDPSHFLVGYEVQSTGISNERGVNRGLCKIDKSLILERLEEIFDVREIDGEFLGHKNNGEEVMIPSNGLCSMNLWGFQPSIFEHLGEEFTRFQEHSGNLDENEFLLSQTMSQLISTARANVQVVPTSDCAIGLTHPDDLAGVKSMLHLAVANGDYPDDLGEWFSERSRQCS
jgi:hypothetical protein